MLGWMCEHFKTRWPSLKRQVESRNDATPSEQCQNASVSEHKTKNFGSILNKILLWLKKCEPSKCTSIKQRSFFSLPKQGTIIREIRQNHHTFALFEPSKWVPFNDFCQILGGRKTSAKTEKVNQSIVKNGRHLVVRGVPTIHRKSLWSGVKIAGKDPWDEQYIYLHLL